jgi:RHS repeat-associated protein
VNDVDTGLTYMQQRYYDSVAGRFLSIDPVLTDVNTGGSFNRYNYANNSPYKYVDPDGRETAILYGGGISSNPFGHIAVAFTGRGVYSYGTGTAPGGSVSSYLTAQSAYRTTGVIIIQTTPAQEAAMIKSLSASNTPLPGTKDGVAAMLNDNCATRTADALTAGGVITQAGVDAMTGLTGVHFPKDVLKTTWAQNPNANSITVSVGSKAPVGLQSFDPPPPPPPPKKDEK